MKYNMLTHRRKSELFLIPIYNESLNSKFTHIHYTPASVAVTHSTPTIVQRKGGIHLSNFKKNVYQLTTAARKKKKIIIRKSIIWFNIQYTQ